MHLARPARFAVLVLLLAPSALAAPPRPQPRPAPPSRPSAHEAFCSTMADRYTKCMTGDKEGFSRDQRNRLVKECLKNAHTRRALETCARHLKCDPFIDCLKDAL